MGTAHPLTRILAGELSQRDTTTLIVLHQNHVNKIGFRAKCQQAAPKALLSPVLPDKVEPQTGEHLCGARPVRDIYAVQTAIIGTADAYGDRRLPLRRLRRPIQRPTFGLRKFEPASFWKRRHHEVSRYCSRLRAGARAAAKFNHLCASTPSCQTPRPLS